MARRWYLWRSERAPSWKTCRRCRNLVLTRKNNPWWVGRGGGFLGNGKVGSVPGGSEEREMLPEWVTAPGSRRWYGCTRMPSVLKCEEPGGKIFTLTPDEVQFKVSG